MPETFATVNVNIVGDLLPIARAFGIMSAALAAYGHEFTDDEMTIIATAAQQITVSTGETLEVGFDIAANPEPTP